MLAGDVEDLPPSLLGLSTTGLLRGEPAASIERWLESACGAGLAQASPDEYRTLSLTALGRDVMAGRVTDVAIVPPQARKPGERSRSRKGGSRGAASGKAGPSVLPPAPEEAVAALRAWRLDEARSRGIAPFIILHDRTLHAIAALRPQSLDDLGDIPGIGPGKLAEYGAAIVAVLKSAPPS
jgi:ATP-dependent DNA helicase RecQ